MAPLCPPLELLEPDSGQVTQPGACSRDWALHWEVQQVGVLLRDPPKGGQQLAQQEVDCDVAAGVWHHGNVHHPSGLRRPGRHGVCHASDKREQMYDLAALECSSNSAPRSGVVA